MIAEAVISGRRAEADRKRELQGMLRLILIEIKDNKRNAEIMLRKPDLITYSPAEFFADDAWLARRPEVAVEYSEIIPPRTATTPGRRLRSACARA